MIHVLKLPNNHDEATQVAYVHQGVGVCGVYEIIETKVNQTMGLAQQNQHRFSAQ